MTNEPPRTHPAPPPPESSRPDTSGGDAPTPPDTSRGDAPTPPDTSRGDAPPPAESLTQQQPHQVSGGGQEQPHQVSGGGQEQPHQVSGGGQEPPHQVSGGEGAEDEIVPLTPPDPVEPQEADAEPEAEEPEPFTDGPPPLPQPMLVLDGDLPDEPAPAVEERVDHGTCRCGGKFDADGWCTECGERKPEPRHHFTARPSDLVAAVCDRGIRHSDNEDAMAVWAGEDGRVALVVCDGVTTATRSAEASMAAAEAALQALSGPTDAPAERLVRATDAAAEAVAQVGRDFPDSAPSCTFVAAVVEDGMATFGSVGDSRGYWIPDAGEAQRLTTDDSLAEEQVRGGIDRATAESSPLAHTITRWLGPDSPDHRPAISTQEVTTAGWVLLCSDGLWNYASEPADLRAVLRAEERRVGRDPLDLAQALVAWANGRGGVDNITVALARTSAGPTATDAPPATAQEETVDTPYPAADEAPREGQDGTHG